MLITNICMIFYQICNVINIYPKWGKMRQFRVNYKFFHCILMEHASHSRNISCTHTHTHIEYCAKLLERPLGRSWNDA